jgi:hypothetical protein
MNKRDESLSEGEEPRVSSLCIFTLIDALGWKFLEGQEFLSDLLPYRRPIKTVLGFSSGAIPTILTGLPPAEHGHWNLYYYDPKGSPFRWLRRFGFLPESLMNQRVTRKLMKEMGRRLLGLGRNFDCCVSPRLLPYFNWVEKRNIYEPYGICGAPSIFDQLTAEGIPYRTYSYHDWTDKEILQRAREDVRRGAASFFFVYLSEMDMLLHNQWANPRPAEERLAWYADQLRELFQTAWQRDPNAVVAVFSDHGMTPVEHHFDLAAEVDRLGFKMPRDYLAVYDSTMGRFWFFSDLCRTQVIEHLGSLECGRWLSTEEQQQLGIFFSDGRYGEAIFLLHPGWIVSKSNFNGPRWMPTGMHGYHPDDPYSDAVFLSNRPAAVPVRTLADVYQCMRAACKLHSNRVPKPREPVEADDTE